MNLPPAGNGQEKSARHILSLCGESLALWTRFHDGVERRQADGGDLAGIRDWASKLAGAVARIAGGLHLVRHASEGHCWEKPIGAISVAEACAIGEYLVTHALAAFGQMGADPSMATARRVLGWIKRRGLTEFSQRDCHHDHSGLTLPDVQAALDALQERGYLRQREAAASGGRGRPKSPVYEVNPLTTKPTETA